MKYTRIYADKEGVSHFEDVAVKLALVDFAPPAPPVFLSPFSQASQFVFGTLPADWFGVWHPTPKRQFSFFLSGEVEVQAGDGELRRFGAGSVFLMEDTIGKGHVTRVLGGSDVLVAILQLPD
ncbi:MAG: cupin domain-containing protein [Chloroflexi bacterium]|nr:cupin domain-containing protein [Chloroflexota bacterium]